jgi:hypothetical protein
MLTGVVAHHSRKLPVWVGISDFVGIDQGDADSSAGRVARAADNHLGVLQWLADRTGPDEWCVVLEDDAVLCERFDLCAELALVCAPSPLVGFYLGTGYPSSAQRVIRPAVSEARQSGASWIVGDYFLSSVAYAIHASVIRDAVADASPRSGELALGLTRWAQSCGVEVAYTAPSLVDHADIESTVWTANGGPERRAWWSDSRRAWNARSVRLGSCPGWSR